MCKCYRCPDLWQDSQMSSLCTKSCSEVTQPLSVLLTRAPAQDWTNDGPSNSSWMDEEKVVELVNIYFIPQENQLNPVLLTGCTDPSMSWLTEYSNAQSLTGESLPGAQFFKVVLIILYTSWQPALPSPVFVFWLGSMQPSTNYLNQKMEIRIFISHI